MLFRFWSYRTFVFKHAATDDDRDAGPAGGSLATEDGKRPVVT